MRRSTMKAAAAVVALSVAIPALAQNANTQYRIGADGSIEEYTASPSTSADKANAGVNVDTGTAYYDAAPVEPVELERAALEAMVDAGAPVAPEPVYTQTYEAPVAAEPAYTETYVAPAAVETAPATPMMIESDIITPVATYDAPETVTTYVEPTPAYAAPAPAYVAPAPVYSEPVYSEPVVVESAPVTYDAAPEPVIYHSPEPDYTTLVDPTPIASIDALPSLAPSGLSYAERGDGAYGQSNIDRGGETQAGQATDIFVSKSAIINLPADAAEVSVSDPNQVRAVLRTARQIVLIGLKVGSTNVIVFDEDNNQILSLDVNVRYDLRPLRKALKRNFPNTHVEVESVLGEVVLTGSTTSPGEATEIRNLVRRYLYSAMLGAGIEVDADTVQFVDRLATDSDDQVMLKVRVAEMRRSVVKQFGVDWSLATNAALAGAAGPTGLVDFARNINTFGVNNAQLGGLSGNIAGSIGSTDFGALVKAFERHNVMRTLAEPTLTAVTGETASFLAGGQFPYPVSIENGQVGFEFRDFGVALEFTPVVVGNGRISLRIATEVSELTNDGALTTATITIPGIAVRRANTTVELPSGGTMSIAGMILQRNGASHAGLPGIKNVPVVGQLFSSSDFLKEETELVILVTPYVVKPGDEQDFRLPTDGFAPASDIDFYLLGRLHKVYGAGDQDIAAARQALQAPLGFIIE